MLHSNAPFIINCYCPVVVGEALMPIVEDGQSFALVTDSCYLDSTRVIFNHPKLISTGLHTPKGSRSMRTMAHIYTRGIIMTILTTTPEFLEHTHLFFSEAGRWVLAVAATFFLAYVVLMTTSLCVSAVRGWARAVSLPSPKLLGHDVMPRREVADLGTSTALLAKQS